MAEKFSVQAGGVASGADKTFVNLFNPAATPTTRGKIYELVIGCDDTPGDQAARIVVQRTTAVGTEGSGLTPHNLDPAGPAGAYDAGLGTFSVEPTYTANKVFLMVSLNQRAALNWKGYGGREFILAATQNNGAGVKSAVSTSTQAYETTILFEE